jgi:hypothetical protein
MSKKTQPAPAQEQPHGEARENDASVSDSATPSAGISEAASSNPSTPAEPAEPTAAGTEAAAPDDLQPPSEATAISGDSAAEPNSVAIPDTALQAAHATLDLTPPAPEKTTVRLLFALGNIPAGKAVKMPAEQAAVLIAQGDADDHPEAVQYALAQAPAVELAD